MMTVTQTAANAAAEELTRRRVQCECGDDTFKKTRTNENKRVWECRNCGNLTARRKDRPKANRSLRHHHRELMRKWGLS